MKQIKKEQRESIKQQLREMKSIQARLSPLTSQLISIGNELGRIGRDYACGDGTNWRRFQSPQTDLVKHIGTVLYTESNYHHEKYLNLEKLLEQYIEELHRTLGGVK